MKAIDTKVISVNPTNGVRTVRTTIIGTTMPKTLPTNGSGITGLLPTDVFAPGSVLFCPDDWSKAMTNENGVFKKKA